MDGAAEHAEVDQVIAPIPVAELELSSPAAAPEANSLGQIVVLVRLHGLPLGTLALLQPDPGRQPDLYALAIERFQAAAVEHLVHDGLSAADLVPSMRSSADIRCSLVAPSSTRLVSVVVCTLGEDPRLVRTVASILDQSHRDLELVVVDNQPELGQVSALLAPEDDPRLRIVAEPRRGLSAARNAGVAAAQGSVIAFTDDDAFADPAWIANLIQSFDEHPDVVCVTGLVLPAELTTAAQVWFEEFGAFDKGYQRTVWSVRPSEDLGRLGRPGEHGVLFPYSAGVYGSGNNMAFRRDWLRAQPLFDEALGAGTLTRGGEDLDAFLTVMLAGGVLVYEPAAVVKHSARDDFAGLRKQMYGYGSGMSAVITKYVVASPRRAAEIALRVPAGIRKLLAPGSEKNAAKTTSYPKELVRAELAGYAAGPVLFVRSRRRAGRPRAAAASAIAPPSSASDARAPDSARP